MILTDEDIKLAMAKGEIVIKPFDRDCIRVNSYDVHLSKHLIVYSRLVTLVTRRRIEQRVLDARQDPGRGLEIEIPEDGYVLYPGDFYLGATVEYTESHRHVPYLDGKSSIGRLGCFIHATAGRGDVGFKGHWTMELSVVLPLRVYPGMPIGQLTWHTCGTPSQDYSQKPGSTYVGHEQYEPKPVPSGLWKKLQAEQKKPEFLLPHCLICNKSLREGQIVCGGLSDCWKQYAAERWPNARGLF